MSTDTTTKDFNFKHKSTDEFKARRAAFIDALCKSQGITLLQLYKVHPSVAARATDYGTKSKWTQQQGGVR